LGDSLTAGYGLSEENAYPAHIQRFIEKDQLDWTAINAGISGDTTKGGLHRLNWVLRSSPTVVFVALGSNDGLRGTDLSYTRTNLKQIIVELKKAKIKVVLSGMQLPANYGESYRKKFKEIFPRLARKYKIAFYLFLLDGVALKPELNLADGLHPNEKGQEIIAEKVYEFLKPILKKR